MRASDDPVARKGSIGRPVGDDGVPVPAHVPPGSVSLISSMAARRSGSREMRDRKVQRGVP